MSDEVIIRNDSFSYEYIKNVIDFINSHNVSFITIQKNFRRVKDRSYLTRFQRYLDNFGTCVPKLTQIRDFVFEKFTTSR